MSGMSGRTGHNLLLQNIEYQTEETAWGAWRRFLYPSGSLFEEFVSHWHILGLPFFHYTRGICPETGKRVVARRTPIGTPAAPDRAVASSEELSCQRRLCPIRSAISTALTKSSCAFVHWPTPVRRLTTTAVPPQPERQAMTIVTAPPIIAIVARA